MDHRHRDVLIAVATIALSAIPLRVRADDASSAPPSASTETKEESAPVAVFGPVLTTEPPPNEARLTRVAPTDPLAPVARQLESAIKSAAQDLDLSLDLTAEIEHDGERELDLVKRAAQNGGAWVFSPRIEVLSKGDYLLRIVAVPPKSATLLVRVERVSAASLGTRAVVMMRDFVTMKMGSSPAIVAANENVPKPEDESARSRGRPLLAASTTLFGLYAAFSIQRSSGSDDPRLLYPLLALGSGIGLGASLLAADEWDVTPASAWTVTGGTWWGVLAGAEIAAGKNVQPKDDRLAWGLLGGFAGTTLAVTALALTHYDEGDAALTNSGAALGTLTGAMIEGIVCGDVGGCPSHAGTPSNGIGFGAAAGLLGGGLLAAFVDTSGHRVFYTDVGAGLGALAGASAASPLLFKDKTATKTRIFLASVLAGTAIGGTIGFLLGREKPPAPAKAEVTPTGGIIGATIDPKTGATLPIYGLGLLGSF